MNDNSMKSRRDFLKQAALGLGIVMLPYPRSLFGISSAKAAAKGKRQHLIHMVDAGGWDTNWFYNFFDPQLNSVHYKDIPPGWTLPALRYGANDYKLFDGHKMAPGMHFWTPTDLSRLALWKGGQQTVGHDFNQVISGGGSSPYNASYSSIIAAAQAAARGSSVLHYVKLSQNQTDCYTSPGMMTGYAIPSCIANQAAFNTLTSSAQNGFVSRNVVDRAISRLADASKARLNRAASTGIINSFSSGYSGANSLSGSNYATSAQFLGFRLRYVKAMQTEAKDQIASGYGVTGGYTSWFLSSYTSFGGFSLTSTSALFTAGDAVTERAKSLAWYYAMAAFLVINDLSAVVDF